MATLTPKQFRKLFECRSVKLPGAFRRAAESVIQEEVEKALVGQAHQLVALAEYLLKASRDPEKQMARRFLEEVHGFLGDYAKAWETVASFDASFAEDLSSTRSFHFYRTVLPGLEFSGILLTKALPRNSRHWSESATAELREMFITVFREESNSSGINIVEHSSRMHDEIASSIQKRSGISFKRRWKERYDHELSLEQRRALRTEAEACAAALDEEIAMREESLRQQVPPAEWELALSRTRALREAWSDGRYWDRKEFLYHYIYQISTKTRDRSIDIRDFYANNCSIRIPFRYAIVDLALHHRIKRIWREAENRLRKRKDMPGIGEGWLGQSKLIAEIRAAFPTEQIESEATPAWLGRMRFDAFLPQRNVAIEYQGEQHDRPVTHFGGEIGHAVTQGRDETKKQLAEANGCKIVYVRPGYSLSKVIADVAHAIAGAPPSIPQEFTSQRMSSGASVRRTTASRRLDALGKHDVPGCARHGSYELIHRLASEGADFAKLGKKNQNSPLYYAAEAGNLGTLRALLELGLKVNEPDCERGATVLARLCCHNEPPSLAAVRLLLEWKADPKIVAPSYLELGKRYGPYRHPAPMVAAAASGNLDLAKLLREFGASVNIRDRHDGNTPFLVACGAHATAGRRSHGSDARFAMLMWLIEQGADTRVQTSGGESGLELAAARLDFRQDWQVFERLIEVGVRLRIKDASRLKREYREAPTPDIERLVRHAEAWGKMPSY